MVLHEMNLEMTTSESCFQADNVADCYRHWHADDVAQHTLPGSTPLLLGEAISILMRDVYDSHALRFANLSTLTLFTFVAGMHHPDPTLRFIQPPALTFAILGLHTIVFQQLSLFTCLPTSLEPVRAALSRWQSLWPLRSDRNIHCHENGWESWQDTGFIGQAQEYAWLVLARLNRVEGQTRGTVGDMVEKTPPPETRLDDTSMTVVTDLMLSLTVGG